MQSEFSLLGSTHEVQTKKSLHSAHKEWQSSHNSVLYSKYYFVGHVQSLPVATGSRQSVQKVSVPEQVKHFLSQGSQLGELKTKPGLQVGPIQMPSELQKAHPVLQFIVHALAGPEHLAHYELSQAINKVIIIHYILWII